MSAIVIRAARASQPELDRLRRWAQESFDALPVQEQRSEAATWAAYHHQNRVDAAGEPGRSRRHAWAPRRLGGGTGDARANSGTSAAANGHAPTAGTHGAASLHADSGVGAGATDGGEHGMSACNRASDSVVGTVGGGRSDDRRGDVAADAGGSSAGSSGLCGACDDAESGGSGSGAGDRASECGSVGDGSGSSVSGAAGKRQRDDVQRGGKGKAQRRNKYADLSSRRGA